MNFDIIGDIHGHCAKLETLLRALGYQHRAGAWRHSDRQAIFVGDVIDRGPEQVRSVHTVRRMTDAGSALAVMGNHELNAIAWHTPDSQKPGEYLRPHFSSRWGDKNRQQHAAFLAEVEHKPLLHSEIIDRFLSLPLWLHVSGIRVVHACWHSEFMAWVAPHLRQGRYLTRELMIEATKEPAEEIERDSSTPSIFKAVESLTKGIEVSLPCGYTFQDKDGHTRDRVRVRWWDDAAGTFRSAAMLSAEERTDLPDSPLPGNARLSSASVDPVFFGHYWLTGTPALQNDRAVCVDYSVGKGGPLVAYRFDGEPRLSAERLVWVG